MPQLWSRSETHRRLRAAAALVRDCYPHVRSNFKVEVGLRTHPVHTLTQPPSEEALYHPEDDLSEFVAVSETRFYPEQLRTPGYVAHLYFSSTGDWGQLEEVIPVWLGAGDQPPAFSRRRQGMFLA